MDMNDASRVISVIDNRIAKFTGTEARTTTTWAQVAGVSDDGKLASAYLYGDTEVASMDFRIPGSLAVSVGDRVKVAWNAGGERWIYDVAVASQYKKVSINPNTGEILTGDGTAPPTPASFGAAEVAAHEAEADPHPQYAVDGHGHGNGFGSLELAGGPTFIDFKTNEATDYDARIIYWANASELEMVGKRVYTAQGLRTASLTVDGSGNRMVSPSGHTLGWSDATLGALEVYNPNTTTGDAYISFHNPGRFAMHLGLDGSTNDLFVGGWSMGGKSKVWSARNSTPPYQMHGGTTSITINGGAGSGYTSISWPQMSAAPDIVLVVQTGLPANSGVWIPKVNGATLTSTGVNIYCYNATGGNAATATAEVRWLAIKYL